MSKDWHKLNPEYNRKYLREWRKRNPDYNREYMRARRGPAKKRGRPLGSKNRFTVTILGVRVRL